MSRPPYDALNLAEHVGDDAGAVAANRERLRQALRLPALPAWLQQVHGVQVVDAAGVTAPVAADAAYALVPGVVCAVLTADCLPVLLCDRGGRAVAAAHAGWRGLAAGVIEQTIAALPVPGGELMAWLGPAIGVEAYVVGEGGDVSRARSCRRNGIPACRGRGLACRPLPARPATPAEPWCYRGPWRGVLHLSGPGPLLLLPPGWSHRPHGVADLAAGYMRYG
jgi:hypothetical protein